MAILISNQRVPRTSGIGFLLAALASLATVIPSLARENPAAQAPVNAQSLKSGELKVGDPYDNTFFLLGEPETRKEVDISGGVQTIWIYPAYLRLSQPGQTWSGRRRLVVPAVNGKSYFVSYEPVTEDIYRLNTEAVLRVTFSGGVLLSITNTTRAPIHSLSEKTSEAFAKIKPLIDEKNWTGVQTLLDSVIPTVSPTSYDMAMILDIKAKLYAQQEQYAKAVEPWEKSLQLSDTYGYFDEKTTLQTAYFLAQLYYQEGQSSKVPAQQQQYILNAMRHLKRWMKDSKKVTAEASMLYASMLFNQALINPDKIDRELLKQARTEVERGLLLSIEPKETFYALLLLILQQDGDIRAAAEVLEFLVKQYPQKKNYWPTLMAFYLNMANEKDEREPQAKYIRAINTVERAQSFGHMKTPKDNYNLVTLYITAGQYGKANELLYAGLKTNTIDSDAKIWGVLGYYTVQAEQPLQAIAVLQEATKLFPTAGQLELQLGEIFRQLEKTRDSYRHYQNAVRKGNLDKPHIGYQLLAYAAFELDLYDEALKAIDEAEKYPEAKKDAQLPKLRKAVEAAIEERKYKNAEAQKKK